jgi:hypothetical protein
MRLVLAALVWVLFVGGTWLYTQQRESSAAPQEFTRVEAAGIYALELTATFPVEADAFTLNKTALTLSLNGKMVLKRTENLGAGERVKVDKVDGIKIGENEFFLEANPPDEILQRSNAVRLRVLRDGVPIADETRWSEPGTKLAVTFRLKIADAEKKVEHEHAH